jgi:lysozyme
VLDLSNNNGAVDFHRVHAAGTRRVYLKLTEGSSFVDGKHAGFRARAFAAGLKVGEYHFARPSLNTPSEEATHFLRALPPLVPGKSLRPCLDLEDPNAAPSRKIATWAELWLRTVERELGKRPIIYGSPGYLGPCGFPAPAPCGLWLASYGRNDGAEHAYVIPRPWSSSSTLAHQYASDCRVAGVAGACDVSHVFKPRALDIRRGRK